MIQYIFQQHQDIYAEGRHDRSVIPQVLHRIHKSGYRQKQGGTQAEPVCRQGTGVIFPELRPLRGILQQNYQLERRRNQRQKYLQ